MDKKTQGSWLIHHTNKLQGVTNQNGYENTFLAGKAGILLSAISSDNELTINNDRLNVLAKAASINTTFELPKLVDVLQQHKLVDKSKGGVAVLGVTTGTTLERTADIFEALSPNATEAAALVFAERASSSPVLAKDVQADIADHFKLSNSNVTQLFFEAEKIGFVDAEKLGGQETLYFNGNLFRRDTTRKIKAVLDSLSIADQANLNELTDTLRRSACVSVDQAKIVLGEALFQKITAIGLFDVNVVSNSVEDVAFMTLPSAFCKFSNSMVEDAFDLAKAFVSSITYGMTKSAYERGQIQMVGALLSALVRGESVGPVRAIAEDYKILELKGVVEVKKGSKNGRSGPMLTLLKKEVGELALQAIRQGDVSEHSLNALPSAAVTLYSGPEANREKIRRNQAANSPTATNDMVSILRTGGGL